MAKVRVSFKDGWIGDKDKFDFSDDFPTRWTSWYLGIELLTLF